MDPRLSKTSSGASAIEPLKPLNKGLIEKTHHVGGPLINEAHEPSRPAPGECKTFRTRGLEKKTSPTKPCFDQIDSDCLLDPSVKMGMIQRMQLGRHLSVKVEGRLNH